MSKNYKTHYFNSKYKRALKKLAKQIARTIKIDTTYLNIPFGTSQIDVHSDGKTVMLVVKTLTKTKKSQKVSEFQFPASDMVEFLMGEEVQQILKNSEARIFFVEKEIMKQVSLGLSNLLIDSKKNKEIWVFPFYNHFISFQKTSVIHKNFNNERFMRGKIYTVQIDQDYRRFSSVLPTYGIVRENADNTAIVQSSLDFSIYEAFITNNYDSISGTDYNKINSRIRTIVA